MNGVIKTLRIAKNEPTHLVDGGDEPVVHKVDQALIEVAGRVAADLTTESITVHAFIGAAGQVEVNHNLLTCVRCKEGQSILLERLRAQT